MPVIRGTNRLPGKLIDWADFAAIAHKSSQASGGKGFGGGSGTEYTYTAAVDIALAMSPCVRIGTIWDSKGSYGSGGAVETFSIPSGSPGSYTPGHITEYSADQGVSIITTTQVWVPAYDPSSGLPQSGGAPGVGNGYYNTVTVYTPMRRASGTPGVGQYQVSGSGSSTVYKFNSADAGKQAKLCYALTTNLAAEFAFFSGSRPQTPWWYMSSKYPSRALAYSGTCHVAAASYDLGSSGSLDNLSFELVGPGVFGGGIQDASVDQCILMVTTDPDGGCGWNPAALGDLSAVLAYTAASGFFFSPIMDKQQTAASYLQDYCDAANLAPLWSEGVLKVIPYGDTPVSGNGYSYVPNLTPIYDLDDDDFLAEGDEPSVKVEREDPEVLSNIIEVDILDRSLGYNTHPIKDKDSAKVAMYGAIPASPRKYDFICDADVGARVANHLRLRATQIDALKATFKLGWQYERLEPMDIVTLTVREQNWVKKPFRLKEGDEDPETGEVEWIAEPVLWGSCSATLYPKQSPGGNAIRSDAAPGSSLTPIIFEPPLLMTASGVPEIWIGTAGDPSMWGGCNVWVSLDGGSSYSQMGVVSDGARMGTLSATLQIHSDPDTADALAVDLSSSFGSLSSTNAAGRDAFLTSCLVENEIVSYLSASLTGNYAYSLTSLRRGVYGTTIAAHASGARFLFLDGAVFKLPYDPSLVGKTIYVKLQAFNTLGKAYQDISTCTAYGFTPAGGSYPQPSAVTLSVSTTRPS